jgi:HSP20 family molecular chaperone IbpA
MSRVPSLSSPFLLGFDEIERVLDRVAKGAEGYPPYNIERLGREGNSPERLRITLAVAGFTRDQLDVTVEENQLVIRGRQQDDKSRQYLHRGIAARHGQGERLRITLAVAGFGRHDLDVSLEENQLIIRGKQQDDGERTYLHRGIAARQFQRTFVLADGMEVLGADLKNGLLMVDLARPDAERIVKTIAINDLE